MRILLVEDDRLLGDGVKAGLCAAGFAVDWVRDGEAALAAVAAESFAAIVLDLGLPRRDGLSVLSALRGAGNAVPVLVLTARDQVADKVRCLDLGADDYVVKPFDLDELAARLRALARRARGRAEASLRHGDVVLDPAARSVTLRGEPVVLTSREFDLLQMLLDAAGRVLTRRVLDEQLYAWGEAVGSNALEVHIHHLRKKLGADLIRTVRGVGYMVDEAPR
ncbi:DNA-binding response regulator [Zoogloea oryzae]|uniref:DNA-binding response regulator n=1 Tax=Zoogloea oryzae TaxID=310767 RepID=A0ABQ6F504_9RHOO|nr:response regulator [Zoogloea oryzae]GLT20638.1 DNA-binding response regulator [Zoogloea oryzae]